MHGSRSKNPSKKLVRQRCVKEFNSGVKGLIVKFVKRAPNFGGGNGKTGTRIMSNNIAG
jgi:hypothetical protein